MSDGRLRWGRGILVGLSMILGLALLAVVAVYVVTSTDWGRERVRRIGQSFIGSMVHGNVKIGRLSGNLLTGMTIHDFSITDSSGAPFATVESFTATYSIVSLLRKHVWIEDAVIVRPLIVLDVQRVTRVGDIVHVKALAFVLNRKACLFP